MPRKPTEPTPRAPEGKLDEKTRLEIFGGSGREQGPGRMTEGEEPPREAHGPSWSGKVPRGKMSGKVPRG